MPGRRPSPAARSIIWPSSSALSKNSPSGQTLNKDLSVIDYYPILAGSLGVVHGAVGLVNEVVDVIGVVGELGYAEAYGGPPLKGLHNLLVLLDILPYPLGDDKG